MIMLLGSTPLAAQNKFSGLWGKYGEKWQRGNRLPDFSFAGYASGEKKIPEYKVSTNVKTTGALGDGEHDDTEAFRKAIESTESGAIYIPEGKYKITDILTIKKSGIVLRGAGINKTVLFFPKTLTDIKPNWGHTTTGKRTSNYSWSGGFIRFEGWYIGKTIAKIAESAKRGDSSLILNDASKIKPGSRIIIYIADNKEHTLFKYLYAGSPGNFSKFKGRVKIPFITRVLNISQNTITIERPLRTDIRTEWTPVIKQFSPSLHDSGIENLTIEFPKTPYKGHFSELGYNGIDFANAAECWAKNIKIHNADSGIFTHSAFCTIKNIIITSARPPKKGKTGHHGIELCGSDNLCESMEFKTLFIHDLGVSLGSFGNVYSDIKGPDLCMDHHKRAPYSNLFTQIDAGKGTHLWHCGGGKNLGKNSAAYETFWNIKTTQPQKYPPNSFAPPLINIIGINSEEEAVTDKKGKWFEPIPPEKLLPQNLYKAQLAKRLKLIKKQVLLQCLKKRKIFKTASRRYTLTPLR